MFSEQRLLCYSRGWVKQYAESKNSKGKEIKIGFLIVRIFLNILPPNMVVPLSMTPVTSLHTGLRGSFWRENM